MADVLMKCGCRANATHNGKPICAVHFLLEGEAATQVAESPNLTGRQARCAYGNHAIVESSLSLAFFEFRGVDSPAALNYCKHCNMHKFAHERGATKCKGFEPHGAHEMDVYYCGCRGFD